MLGCAFLRASLVLWLAQQSLQGGVQPQAAGFGKIILGRGPRLGAGLGVGGVKAGGPGLPLGGQVVRGYVGKPGKAVGRYPSAPLGNGGYRPTVGRFVSPGFGAQGAYGPSLGVGIGMKQPRGFGGNGYAPRGPTLGGYGGVGAYPGAGLGGVAGAGAGYANGQAGKAAKPGYGAGAGFLAERGAKAVRPGYGAGVGAPAGQGKPAPSGNQSGVALTSEQGAKANGYGVGAGLPAGQGAKAAKQGYGAGAGGYPGAALGNGLGAGLGQGGYPQAGKSRPAGYGNGYAAGGNGYGAAGNGYAAAGNGYGAAANGYGAGLSVPSVLADGAGLGGKAGKGAGLGVSSYEGPSLGALGGNGGAAQLPYGGQPVVPAGLGANGKLDSYIAGPQGYGGQLFQPTGLGDEAELGGLGAGLSAGLDSAAGKYGGYPYGAQPLGLGADGKFRSAGYMGAGVQPAGYNGQLGNGQGPNGGKSSKYGLNGFLGNGYKG
ncbi:hypothetical protein MATL_G00215620 [Megalops atlanticus]|uniref:Elastin n=1 Tax=Megalops atlanticus TaxID=7932 RepID=A0A9D3PKJ8_MEGAT|nr:hypothetical protein MATL_G00215620 [Megalops atlanticus]